MTTVQDPAAATAPIPGALPPNPTQGPPPTSIPEPGHFIPDAEPGHFVPDATPEPGHFVPDQQAAPKSGGFLDQIQAHLQSFGQKIKANAESMRPAPGTVDAEISKQLGGTTPDTELVKLPAELPFPRYLPQSLSALDPGEWNAAVYKGVAPAVSGLSTPKNLALLAGGSLLKGAKLAATVVDAYFAGTMAQQFGEQAGEFMNLLDDPKSTWQDKVSKLAQLGSTGAFTGLAAAGAAGGARDVLTGKKAPTPPLAVTEQAPKAEAGATPPQLPVPTPEKAESIQAQADAARTAARAKEVEEALAAEERAKKSPAQAEAHRADLAAQEKAPIVTPPPKSQLLLGTNELQGNGPAPTELATQGKVLANAKVNADVKAASQEATMQGTDVAPAELDAMSKALDEAKANQAAAGQAGVTPAELAQKRKVLSMAGGPRPAGDGVLAAPELSEAQKLARGMVGEGVDLGKPPEEPPAAAPEPAKLPPKGPQAGAGGSPEARRNRGAFEGAG